MMVNRSYVVIISVFFILLPTGSCSQQTLDFVQTEQFKDHIEGVVSNYFKLKDAMAAESDEYVKKYSESMLSYFNEVNPANFPSDMKNAWLSLRVKSQKNLRIIQEYKELDKRDKAFIKISEALYDIIKEFGPIDYTVYLQYCSKVNDGEGVYWLNEKREIVNPYGGKDLLRCGSVREIIEGG